MAVVTEQDREERGCERLESPARLFTQAREKRFFLSTTGMNTEPSPPCHARLWVLSMRAVKMCYDYYLDAAWHVGHFSAVRML